MPNTITGTSGDDTLYGTSGSDIFYPGANYYGDTIYDAGGDDYYVLESGYAEISDWGGTDVVRMVGVELADLNFTVQDQWTVSFWTDDWSRGAWFWGMWDNPANGVDTLILDDVTLSRAQILTYAEANFGL
jgi:Ca2+-binding RTX toxin-like protein